MTTNLSRSPYLSHIAKAMLLVILSVPSICFGQSQAIQLLREAANFNEANVAKLKTWHAKYEFVDKFAATANIVKAKDGTPLKVAQPESQRGKVIQERKGTVEFWMDFEAERLLVHYVEAGDGASAKSESGEELTALGYKPMDIKVLRTAADETRLIYNFDYGPLPNFKDDPYHAIGTPGKMATKVPLKTSMKECDTDEVVDPRELLRWQRGNTAWDSLRIPASALEGKYGADHKARSERLTKVATDSASGHMTISAKFSSAPPDAADQIVLTDAVVLDTKQSCLPIRYTMNDASGFELEAKSWSWQRDSAVDCLLPSSYSIVSHDPKSKKLILQRRLSLVVSEVNQPLTDELYEGMGFEKGVRLKDSVKNELLIHDGIKLVDVKHYGKKSKLGLYLGVGIAFFCLAAAFFARRRAR